MAEEPDNLVLAHLRELRAAMDRRFDLMEKGSESRFGKIEQRLERIEANSAKAIRSFVGHRSMVERTVADYDGDISDLKRRVKRLEDAAG